jgi:hypothetical protein
VWIAYGRRSERSRTGWDKNIKADTHFPIREEI